MLLRGSDLLHGLLYAGAQKRVRPLQRRNVRLEVRQASQLPRAAFTRRDAVPLSPVEWWEALRMSQVTRQRSLERGRHPFWGCFRTFERGYPP